MKNKKARIVVALVVVGFAAWQLGAHALGALGKFVKETALYGCSYF